MTDEDLLDEVSDVAFEKLEEADDRMEKKMYHIRPWYRSRIVWLGAPGFLFIFWLWWDSFQFVRVLHTPDRVDHGSSIVRYFSFHSRVGILGVTREGIDYSKRQKKHLPDRGFSAQSTPLHRRGWENLREKNSSPFQFPIAFFHRTDKEIETSYFYVAHWFLLLVYAGAWGVLLSYRNSRLRRACIPSGDLSDAGRRF